MKRYLLPISCIDSFGVPTFRLRHVIGTIP